MNKRKTIKNAASIVYQLKSKNMLKFISNWGLGDGRL